VLIGQFAPRQLGTTVDPNSKIKKLELELKALKSAKKTVTKKVTKKVSKKGVSAIAKVATVT